MHVRRCLGGVFDFYVLYVLCYGGFVFCMLSLSVFSVFDSKVGAYLTPFFVANRAVALRSFMAACQDEQSDFHRFAGDFTLFEIGLWNSETGDFVPLEAKLNLGLASQFLIKKER